MQPWEIHWNDWTRIFFGNVPPEFFVELLIRVTFVYLLVIFCIRMMGKRMAAQLSRNELVAIASLAASIGIPIQSPERGLLPAVIVAMLVVTAQRVISGRLSRNERFERRSQGNISVLVDDCCLNPGVMKKTRVSRNEVMARLRSMKVMHLGQVRRLYFEAEGDFTLIYHEDSRPGLSVLPEEDPEFLAEQNAHPELTVCGYCGRQQDGSIGFCRNCGHKEFVPAVD